MYSHIRKSANTVRTLNMIKLVKALIVIPKSHITLSAGEKTCLLRNLKMNDKTDDPLVLCCILNLTFISRLKIQKHRFSNLILICMQN